MPHWSLALWFQRRGFLKGFYHIWAWRPSCSCDPDAPNKLSFPRPMEAPHEIWLRLAQRFWRRRSLKMVDGRTTTDDNGRQRTTDGACQYYKLTNEHKGSGELKTNLLLKSVYFRVSGRPGTGDTQLLESWP